MRESTPDPRHDKRYEWMTNEELAEMEASTDPHATEKAILARRSVSQDE